MHLLPAALLLLLSAPGMELDQPLDVPSPALRALAHSARALVTVAADVRVETDPDGEPLAVADVNGILTELKAVRPQAEPWLAPRLDAFIDFTQRLQRDGAGGASVRAGLADLLEALASVAATDYPFQYDLGEAWVALSGSAHPEALRTRATAAVAQLVQRFPTKGRVYGLQARLEVERPAPLQTQLALFKRCADLDVRAKRCLEGYLTVSEQYEVPRCLHDAVRPDLRAISAPPSPAAPLFSAAQVESITLRRQPGGRDSLEVKLIPAAAAAFAQVTATLAAQGGRLQLLQEGQEVVTARVSAAIPDGRLALNPGETPAVRLLARLCRVTEQRRVPEALRLTHGPTVP